MTDLQTLYAEYMRIKIVYDEIAKEYMAASRAYDKARQAEALAAHGLALGDRILVTPELSALEFARNGIQDDRFKPGTECAIASISGYTEGAYTHISINSDGVHVGGFEIGMIVNARRAWLTQQEQAAG